MKIVVAGLLLLIAGCTTTKPVIIDNTKVIVIQPPKSLYNCPAIGKIPSGDQLTNKQVIQFINKLYKYHQICKINIEQIQKFVEQASQRYKS